MLVVGDIHGGLKALKQVLQRALVTENDSLIFLGDYVDGWSESAGVLEFVMQLNKKQPCVFIKGNHDVWCQEWLRTGFVDETWIKHGGLQTMESYTQKLQQAKTIHLQFLEAMQFYYIDGQNRLFIHAGFTSTQGPEKEFGEAGFRWDRTLWETAVAMSKNMEKHYTLFPERLNLFSEIYIGHTPTLYYNQTVPMQGCNVWNVDTGAAFTGKLSVMDADTKQFWQSDALPFLYPGERGRNK